MFRISCPLLLIAIVGVGLSFAQSPETVERRPKVAILECGFVDNTAVSQEAQSKLTKAIVSSIKSSGLILKPRTLSDSTMKGISFGFSSFGTPETAAGIVNLMGLDAGYIVNAEEDVHDLILSMTRIDAEGSNVVRDRFVLSLTSPHIETDRLFQNITLNPNVPTNRGSFPGWLKWTLGGLSGAVISYLIWGRDKKDVVEVAPPALPK